MIQLVVEGIGQTGMKLDNVKFLGCGVNQNGFWTWKYWEENFKTVVFQEKLWEISYLLLCTNVCLPVDSRDDTNKKSCQEYFHNFDCKSPQFHIRLCLKK